MSGPPESDRINRLSGPGINSLIGVEFFDFGEREIQSVVVTICSFAIRETLHHIADRF